MTTTFYRTRYSVARLVRTPDGTIGAVYNLATRTWVEDPTLTARITGIGGDGLDVITRDQARAIIDGSGAAPRLDGPGSDRPYGTPSRTRE